MRLRRPFSFVLSLLTLTSGITFADAALCTPVAWAQSTYGSDGQSGFSGRDGRSGRTGEDTTLFVDGSDRQLNLSGSNGSDGEDGDSGRSARCGGQPRDASYDLRAPNGGNGGNGGDGGNGGNGGSVTLYYDNLADLRRIQVLANAGQGGRGGRGGYGGQGCMCDRRSWEIETCSGGSCYSRRYSCTDGRDGQPGQPGSNGQPGQLGRLTIINQMTPLAPEVPSMTDTLSSLIDRPVPLSKNLWTLRQGAVSLLAPGSVVADQYDQYAGRMDGNVTLRWTAPRPLREFSGEQVTVQFTDELKVAVGFPPEIWVDGEVTQQEGDFTYTVTNVVRQQEATRLQTTTLSGSGSNLQLFLVDLAGQSNLIRTAFQIEYRTADREGDRRRPTYRTRYEGTLPPEFINRDYNRFVLALGQLPIEARYLTPGTRAEIKITAIRSFADNVAEQSLDWRGEIRR